MPYIRVITSTASWTCPETGSYKVICVGQGGNGSTSALVGASGKLSEGIFGLTSGQVINCGITSVVTFGSLLSAASGGTAAIPLFTGTGAFTITAVGGEGGYTLDGMYGGFGASLGVGTISTGTIGIPATKNGGAPGRTGLGYGAGGGYYYDGTTAYATQGSGGAVVIVKV